MDDMDFTERVRFVVGLTAFIFGLGCIMYTVVLVLRGG